MRLKQTLIALDQLANAMAGGWADETLSARAWRCRDKTRAWAMTRRAIDALFFWERGHCAQAYLAERARHQLPAEYRPREAA